MYSNLEQIQSGSFSTVYKAWCSTLDKYVALKVIPKHKYSESGMMNEFEVMKLLGTRHPNICSMIDYYEDDNNYTLVLEYCECGDLYDFLDIVKSQGNVNHPAIIQLDFTKIIHQLFSALEYAHTLGIAHRDIKPENILLTKEGNIKLADWGHATLEPISDDYNIGTDNYRAPETFGCLNGYDTIQCDAWGVGVTLFYLMFGQCPFRNAQISNLDNVAYQDHLLPQKKRNIETCLNFQNFVKDPYGFIYRYFLEPIVSVHQGRQYNAKEGKPTLYVWQDMVNIYQIFYVCRIIIDNLAAIDATDRSMENALLFFDKIWHYKDSLSSINTESDITKLENSSTNIMMKGTIDTANIGRKQIIGKSS